MSSTALILINVILINVTLINAPRLSIGSRPGAPQPERLRATDPESRLEPLEVSTQINVRLLRKGDDQAWRQPGFRAGRKAGHPLHRSKPLIDGIRDTSDLRT